MQISFRAVSGILDRAPCDIVLIILCLWSDFKQHCRVAERRKGPVCECFGVGYALLDDIAHDLVAAGVQGLECERVSRRTR